MNIRFLYAATNSSKRYSLPYILRDLFYSTLIRYTCRNDSYRQPRTKEPLNFSSDIYTDRRDEASYEYSGQTAAKLGNEWVG